MINTNFSAKIFIAWTECCNVCLSVCLKTIYNRSRERFEAGQSSDLRWERLRSPWLWLYTQVEFLTRYSSYSDGRTTGITSLQGDQMARLDLQTCQGGWQEIILCCACNVAYNILGLRRKNCVDFTGQSSAHLDIKVLELAKNTEGWCHLRWCHFHLSNCNP